MGKSNFYLRPELQISSKLLLPAAKAQELLCKLHIDGKLFQPNYFSRVELLKQKKVPDARDYERSLLCDKDLLIIQ